MPRRRDTIEMGMLSAAGGDVVEFEERAQEIEGETEAFEDVEQAAPSEQWTHWQQEVRAALEAEKRFREEGRAAERDYFGEDDKAYTTEDYRNTQHRTNIIHANIEVLKPLVFSDKPAPIIQRRFGGDGKNDPTDRLASLAAQRMAEYLIDTGCFEEAVELARDDWLVPGRGVARVKYETDFEAQPVPDPQTGEPLIDPETGQPIMVEAKANERIKLKHWPWSRVMFSAANSWEEVRWVGFETPMTRKKVEQRFGPEIAAGMDYPINGLKAGSNASASMSEMAGYEPDRGEEQSNTPSVSAHDQCIVIEIWDKESRKVLWWSPNYRDDLLEVIEDPMHLEGFFDCPKPLLAVTKNGMMTPRPDTAFYRARAEEIDTATRKLNSILQAISVSGLYPGAAVEEIKELLKGDRNRMIPVQEWIALMEKGGTGPNGIIQWLPLDTMLKAAQGLVLLREQAKMQLYEISGISDIVRGQSNPNETLGAQQIKGNYANLRLRDKQRKVHLFARDLIRIMIEMAFEHFDTQTIVDIVSIADVPMTEADLEMMNVQVQQMMQQHMMMAQIAQQIGQPPPPEPDIPFYEQTSWERIHNTLRDDLSRKFVLSIETDGTILSDPEEDKRQRVEFLGAFSAMVQQLMPIAMSGALGKDSMKIMKELLMFAVRGFPKSRTLEGMIASLPEDVQQQPSEDPRVTVAKLKAEVDKQLAEMEIAAEAQEGEAERQHEMRMKGVDILADAALAEVEAASAPPPARKG